MIRTARMLTRYNAWSNKVMFDAVAALPAGEAVKDRQSLFRNMLHTLNHNFVIDDIWRAHLEGRGHGYAARNTADHPALAELRQMQQAMDAWYVAAFDALTDAALDEKIGFTLIGGTPGTMTRNEILLHVVNHTSYHRGFVCDMFFAVPARPPTMDLPVFLREVPQP